MAHRVMLKVALICALVLAAIVLLAVSPTHDLHLATTCPGPSSPAADGTPAIHPRNDCTPSFIEQDVRSYLATQLPRVLPNDIVGYTGQPQVVSSRFLPLRDLSRAPNAPAWLMPSERLVCYVVVRGHFLPLIGSGDIIPPSARASILRTVRPVYLVFDAHSGNLLGSAFGDLLG